MTAETTYTIDAFVDNNNATKYAAKFIYSDGRVDCCVYDTRDAAMRAIRKWSPTATEYRIASNKKSTSNGDFERLELAED